jgi:hypothetical protein
MGYLSRESWAPKKWKILTSFPATIAAARGPDRRRRSGAPPPFRTRRPPGVNAKISVFRDFHHFSAKNLAIFLKTNVVVKFLNNLALFRVKNANFSVKIFYGPVSQVGQLRIQFLDFVCSSKSHKNYLYICVIDNLIDFDS